MSTDPAATAEPAPDTGVGSVEPAPRPAGTAEPAAGMERNGASKEERVPVPLLPLAGMGASSAASAASGLYAAAGIPGLIAGGATAAAGGVWLAARTARRRRSAAMQSVGWKRTRSWASGGSSGGWGGGSRGGSPFGGSSGRGSASQAIAGRRAAAGALGSGSRAGSAGSGGRSGSGGGWSSGSPTGSRTGSGFGSRGGSGGRTGLLGGRSGSAGATGSGSRGGGFLRRTPPAPGSPAAYRAAAARRYAAANYPPGARRAMARTRAGRAALAAGRGAAHTGRALDRATGRRASRRWARIRPHLRRGAARRLIAADQAWSADFAAGLAVLIARGAHALRGRLRRLTRPAAQPVTDLPDTVNPGPRQSGGAGNVLEGRIVSPSPEAMRIINAADELRDALAAYGRADIGMLAYGEGLAAVPHAMEQVQIGLTGMSMTAIEEKPVSGAVVEFLLNMAASEGLLAAKARELLGIFAGAHEADILRLTGGRRPNEWLWDRAANLR